MAVTTTTTLLNHHCSPSALQIYPPNPDCSFYAVYKQPHPVCAIHICIRMGPLLQRVPATITLLRFLCGVVGCCASQLGRTVGCIFLWNLVVCFCYHEFQSSRRKHSGPFQLMSLLGKRFLSHQETYLKSECYSTKWSFSKQSNKNSFQVIFN